MIHQPDLRLMKKQLSCITFIIIFAMSTQLAYAQTKSYPTDRELQKLMPDFRRQVQYWSEYQEPERQSEARAFAASWFRDPAVAPFLGEWGAWEETMEIYPSSKNGQVCIIHTYGIEEEVRFNLGNVLNQRIYTDVDEVIIQQGNYTGVAWKNGVNVYRLIAPAEVPTRASWIDWREGSRVIEQFNAVGCITPLKKG